MPNAKMNDLLKKRMAATQQVSELQVGEAAYEALTEVTAPVPRVNICDLPMDKLVTFFTADIGFRPYPPAKLEAFAQQLAEEGLFERIIVRPIPGTDRYEILAGHNRVAAGKLNGWATIPAQIVDADDTRATVIATATNLLRRDKLTIIEQGKAYKALLDAKNRNGQHDPSGSKQTFGDNRQRYNARAIVAEFFCVTEYEIRKAVKLTQLIPQLQDILVDAPKRLNLACAELIADYDPASQEAFVEMCSIEGYTLNKAALKHIVHRCPPPSAQRQEIHEAWREARRAAEKRLTAPPKKITFDRRRFAPYLNKLDSDRELEALFLEFLRERTGLA